jgi:hypothetical protein
MGNIKLYTEEQMIQAFAYGKTLEPFDCFEDMIDSLKPIELPSDEEIENKLYSAIELAIIRWNLDGTKTAGSLTREIISIIKQQQNEEIK